MQVAIQARETLPERQAVAQTSLRYRPLPRVARRSRLTRAMLWLYHLLLTRPVGRRAREERVGALPERVLRDIGLDRANLVAARADFVSLGDVMPTYPSPGPLYVCGRPDFRLTLVRLDEAA